MKGTIRKRGKKFQVIFPYKDSKGEWKQRSATFASSGEAKAKLKEWNYEDDSIAAENPLLSKVAEMWIEEVKLTGSKNTISAYKRNFEFVLARIEDKPIKEYIRSDFVSLYKQITSEGYEVSAYKSAIGMVMNYAMKSGYIIKNPALGISTRRTKEKRSAVMLSRQERYEMLQALNGTSYYYLTFLILKTGLRIGEALGLDWENIDLDKKEMRIEQQMLLDGAITTKLKSKNSYRTIILDNETTNILREFAMSPFNSGSLLFKDSANRTTYSRKLMDFGVTPHDLRHNHGTDLLNICNIADAAKRMGHTTDEYVNTYVHPTNEAQKMIAKKLDEPQYSLCDNFVTEGESKVIRLRDINA